MGVLRFFVFAGSLACLPLVYYIGRRLRAYAQDKRIFSPVEVISQRYGSRRLGLFLAIIFTLFMMPYISLQLVGIGAFIEAYTDGQITYAVGVGSMMVIVLLYLFLGGMRVVAYTDFIQMSAIIIALVAGILYLLNHFDLTIFGIFRTISETSPAHLWVPGPQGQYTYAHIGTVGIIIIGIFFQPHVLTRTMMAKSDRDIRFMLLGTMIGYLLILFIALTYGYMTYLTFGSELAPNFMMGHVFKEMAGFNFLGLILSTLMVMGALGAAMSTADSLLLAIGQVCTRDMVRPFFKISRGKQVLLSKFIMFLVLFAAFFTGLEPPKFMMDLAFYSAAGCAVLVPTLLTLDWRSRSLFAAYASIILGLAALLIIIIFKDSLTGLLAEMHVGIVPMLIAFLVYYGLCLIRRPNPDFYDKIIPA